MKNSTKNFRLGCLDFIARYLYRPLMWSRIRDVVLSSVIQLSFFTLLLQLVPDTTNFSSPLPLVCLKVFILLSRSCCTMLRVSMGKQTNSLCPKSPRVLGLGLPQANSSLFGLVALIYLSRQHQKSDSHDRYALLEWKRGAYAWWS